MWFVKRIFDSEDTVIVKIFVKCSVNTDDVFPLFDRPMFSFHRIEQEELFHHFKQVDRWNVCYFCLSSIELVVNFEFIRLLCIVLLSLKLIFCGIWCSFSCIVDQVYVTLFKEEVKHQENHGITGHKFLWNDSIWFRPEFEQDTHLFDPGNLGVN